jgi:thiol-disulfide isomerase/thioredoxin
MPKCRVCGKNLSTLSALREHHRAVHPNQRFVAPKSTVSRNLIVGIVVVIIVIGSAVGYLIYSQSQVSTITAQTGVLNQAIPSSLYNNLTGVSTSTLATIGSGGVSTSAISSISGSSLTYQGKPEILYIGAEYCPFCAAERWSMIIALSKFGNFTGLEYMQSSSTDTYSNTATFTFLNANYSSSYISFVSVEYEDRNRAPLQAISPSEKSLQNQYDSGGSIPFIDLANKYVDVGSQYSPSTIAGLTWTQIASQLNNPNSAVAKAIDGSANQLITAICKIDGGSPGSVCSQSFATVPLAFSQGGSDSSSLSSLFLFASESRTTRPNFSAG